MNIEVLDKPSTELTVQHRAALALGSTQTRLDLVAMAAKSAHLIEVKNKAARDEVHGAAMALASARVAISKTSKAARDDATKFSKACIAEESSLIEITAPEEKRLLALRDEWDSAVAAEKAAKELVERNRITEIHRRIAEIRSYQALATGCRTSAAIQTLIDKLAEIELTGFEEFEEEAKTARVDTMHAMEAAHAQKFADEAERARVKAEQEAAAAELAKARAELAEAKAEQERIAKVNRDAAIAEADKLATARQAFEDEQAKAKAERQAFEERVKAKQAEDDLAAYKEAVAPVVIAQEAIENVANLAQVCEIVQTVDSSKSAQDDAEVDPDPAFAWTGTADVLPEQPRRPTDREILAVLEAAYFVTAPTAFHWLQNINMKALQAELIEEMK